MNNVLTIVFFCFVSQEHTDIYHHHVATMAPVYLGSCLFSPPKHCNGTTGLR